MDSSWIPARSSIWLDETHASMALCQATRDSSRLRRVISGRSTLIPAFPILVQLARELL
jgi:hypothetical protein